MDRLTRGYSSGSEPLQGLTLGCAYEDSTVNVLFSAVQVEEAATCGYGALLVLVDKPTSVAADEQVV